jgi:hypothetical protein
MMLFQHKSNKLKLIWINIQSKIIYNSIYDCSNGLILINIKNILKIN